MKTVHKRLLSVFAVVLVLYSLFLSAGNGAGVPVFAESSSYTSVMEDLQKDEKFDLSDYPENAKDYSVQVKQIAESSAGELFIYTYQPCRKTRALSVTAINMALSKEFENTADSKDVIDLDDGYYVGGSSGGIGGSTGGGGGGGGSRPCSLSADTAETSEGATQTKLYPLTLLSSSGVFSKYKVNNFTVRADKVRYYNITSIYREWDTKIDGVQTGSQTVNEKAYAVGQLWTVGTFGDSVYYDMTEIEVIKITAQEVGFRRYSEGFKFQGTYSCDSHYLAFSCDHVIDRLVSADISFYTRDYKAVAGSGTKYESKVSHNRTLYDYEKVETDSDGWFDGGDYVWDRMSSTSEYVESLRKQGSSITDEEVQKLTSYDWILCFYETEYKCSAGGKDVLITCLVPFGFVWTTVNACTTTGTIVSNVTLMRLEFEYDGTIYNLGVISDKQTGSEKPSGGEVAPIAKFFNDLWKTIKDFFTGHSDWWIYLLIGVVVLIVGLPLLFYFIPAFGSVLLSVLKAIGKALLWLISAPFRGIAWLFRKIFGKE